MTENTENGHHVGPSVIELDLTDEIQDAQLMTKARASFGSKSVILELNHKYENKIVEFYPIDLGPKRWTKTLDRFENKLESEGVEEKDRTALRHWLNQRSGEIGNHFSEQSIARMTASQKARKERAEELRNSPPLELPIKDVLRKHEGNFTVRGMVNGLGVVEKVYTAVGFRCSDCDEINRKWYTDQSDSRPRFADEMPRIDPRKMTCAYCQSKDDKGPFFHDSWAEVANAQRIVLFDTETFSDLESLNVVLLDDYTRDVRAGEQVVVTGSLHKVSRGGKTQAYLYVGLNPINGVEKYLEHVDRKESVTLKEGDEENIRKFIADNSGNELEALVGLMAPSIIGEKHLKKGLLMAYINSGKDPVSKRRRLNSLLIGDPGLGKSKALRYMVKLGGGNSQFASAADASAKSLIAVYDTDDKIIFMGAVPKAHGSICSIDEVGRMSPEDQGYLLSAMEEGEIPWARFGRGMKLPASDTFVLAANPVGNSGRLKDAVRIDNSEYPLIGQVRDRVDFFFIFRKSRDNINAEMNYAYDKLKLEENSEEISRQEDEGINFLQKLYKICQGCDPSLSTEARQMLTRYYAGVVNEKNSPFSRRLLESLKNTCYAIARIKLKEIIDEDDAKETIEFFKVQMKEHKITITVPQNPRRDAAEKIIAKLRVLLPEKYTWIELLDAVCKDDLYVSQYVGFDKDGQRDWSESSNKKVRNIRQELITLLPSYEGEVLVFPTLPLRLAWKKTYNSEDRDTAVDPNTITTQGKVEVTEVTEVTPSGTVGTVGTPRNSSENASGADGTSKNASETGGTPKNASGTGPGAENKSEDVSESVPKGVPGKSDLSDLSDLSSSEEQKTDITSDIGVQDGKKQADSAKSGTNIDDVTPKSSDGPPSEKKINDGPHTDDDIHKIIIRLNQEGKSQREIAEILNTSKTTVNRVLKVNQDSLTPNQESLTPTSTEGGSVVNQSNSVKSEPEDYEAYVSKQAERVAVIDKEHQRHKEDQKSTAVRRIFDELASKNVETNPGTNEVLESKFREALMYNGMGDADIDATIKGMENDKIIERVGTELDGVRCDILRVINW